MIIVDPTIHNAHPIFPYLSRVSFRNMEASTAL